MQHIFISKCSVFSSFKLSYIMHIDDENIMHIEEEIFLGKVNKFTEEISKRRSSSTTEVFF